LLILAASQHGGADARVAQPANRLAAKQLLEIDKPRRGLRSTIYESLKLPSVLHSELIVR
jgi:hypothetical protein